MVYRLRQLKVSAHFSPQTKKKVIKSSTLSQSIHFSQARALWFPNVQHPWQMWIALGVVQKLRGQDGGGRRGVGGQKMPIIVHIQDEKYPHAGKSKRAKICLRSYWMTLGLAMQYIILSPILWSRGKWMTLQSNLWVPFVICYQIVISFSVCSKEKIKAKQGKNDKWHHYNHNHF